MLGSTICRLLSSAGHSPRGLVRKTAAPARTRLLADAGVQLVEGDLRSPASLVRACRGVHAVISTASAMTSRQPGDSLSNVDDEGQRDLIDAATAAGVSQFVLISLSSNVSPSPLLQAKRRTEDKLGASKIRHTILRSSFLTEIWLSQALWPKVGFDFARRKARVPGAGLNRVSWISVGDVARFAAGAIDNPRSYDRTLEIGGPTGHSFLEIVALLEQLGKRPFAVEHLSEDTLSNELCAAKDPFESAFSSLLLSCAHATTNDIEPALAAIPISLSTIHAHLARIVKYD